MPNTMPEGFTPQPQLVAEVPTRLVGSHSFITVLSIILGIILATGTVVGVAGKAFYVERGEYTQKSMQDAQDRVTFTEGRKGIGARLDRQDVALNRLEINLDKMANIVQDIKVEQARRRGK